MFPASNKIGFTPPILASPSGEATIRDPELHAGGVEPPARSLLVEQLAGNRALIGRPFRPEDEGQVTIPTPSTSQRRALRLGPAAAPAPRLGPPRFREKPTRGRLGAGPHRLPPNPGGGRVEKNSSTEVTALA